MLESTDGWVWPLKLFSTPSLTDEEEIRELKEIHRQTGAHSRQRRPHYGHSSQWVKTHKINLTSNHLETKLSEV